MLRIVVVDDNSELVERMRETIEGAVSQPAHVIPLTGASLRDAIGELRDRERSWDKHGARWYPQTYDAQIDSADILVLDYRLADLYDEGFMTGEDLAALARRYSRAGPIVSVNRFGPRSFDLRLRREVETWAEISVAHEDLENPRLWSAEASGLYRPWGWASLQQLPQFFARRVRHALNHLDRPVAKTLGISSRHMELMPTRVSEALSNDPLNATFREVALERAFQSQKVPRPSRPQMARIAAAEVGKWLSNIVLPGEEILIDAPHLATQYPSLIQRSRDRRNLNGLAVLGPDAELPLDATEVRGARFRPTFWLDRPVWWVESILENRELAENRRPWKKRPLNHRFAEDTSRFHRPTELHAFQAVGSFSERYVQMPDDGVDYKPANRLLG